MSIAIMLFCFLCRFDISFSALKSSEELLLHSKGMKISYIHFNRPLNVIKWHFNECSTTGSGAQLERNWERTTSSLLAVSKYRKEEQIFYLSAFTQRGWWPTFGNQYKNLLMIQKRTEGDPLLIKAWWPTFGREPEINSGDPLYWESHSQPPK